VGGHSVSKAKQDSYQNPSKARRPKNPNRTGALIEYSSAKRFQYSKEAHDQKSSQLPQS